jgi:hypothetical protein
MVVNGFTIDKKDPKQRIPTEYASQEERAWGEAASLAGVELFEEADMRFSDYLHLQGGIILDNDKDAKLAAQISVGLARHRMSEKYYHTAQKSVEHAFYSNKDGFDGTKEISDWAVDLVRSEIEHAIKIPKGDQSFKYAEVSAEKIAKAAKLWMWIIQNADSSSGSMLSEVNDTAHMNLKATIDAMFKKDSSRAWAFADKALKLDKGFFEDTYESVWKVCYPKRESKQEAS